MSPASRSAALVCLRAAPSSNWVDTPFATRRDSADESPRAPTAEPPLKRTTRSSPVPVAPRSTMRIVSKKTAAVPSSAAPRRLWKSPKLASPTRTLRLLDAKQPAMQTVPSFLNLSGPIAPIQIVERWQTPVHSTRSCKFRQPRRQLRRRPEYLVLRHPGLPALFTLTMPQS